MEKIGTLVVYGANGVCRIDDIRTEKLGGTERSYYVLKPTRGTGSSTIFVPTDNDALVSQMKPLLSREEAIALFHEVAMTPDEPWIADARARGEHYKSVLATGKRRDILAFMRTLRIRRGELETRGKRLCVSDETLLSRAEDIFLDEISLAFELSREEAAEMLWRELKMA